MWPILLPWILQVVPVIPSLVADVENLFRGKPKAGQAKAATVAQAISSSIADITTQLAAAAPPGTEPAEIADACAAFAAAINDATVMLANKLKIFPHTPAPADAPALNPTDVKK